MSDTFMRYSVRLLNRSDIYEVVCTYPDPFSAIGDAFKYAHVGYAVDVSKYYAGQGPLENLLNVEPQDRVREWFSRSENEFDIVDQEDVPTDQWLAGTFKVSGPLLDWLTADNSPSKEV